MKKVLTGTVFSFALLTGWAQAMEPQEPQSYARLVSREETRQNGLVHRDEERGFSIGLPATREWEIVLASEAGVALSLEGPGISMDVAIQRTSNVLELDFLGILSRDSAREREDSYREFESQLMTDHAPPFYVLEYECRREDKTLHVLKRIYVKGQRVASISVVGEVNTWARNRRVILKMLESFAFLEEPSTDTALSPGNPGSPP